MILKLRFPHCGFNFMVGCPDDLSEEELLEIKSCPCGALMQETEELYANVLSEDADG